MPFEPAVAPGETVLVACHDSSRRGVKFHVVLTERRLIHARATMLSTDGIVTESQPLSEVRDAAIGRMAPYGRWLFGAFCLLGFVTYLAGVLFGSLRDANWYLAALMVGSAGTAFATARHRVRLSWRAGNKRYRLTTPGGGAAAGEALREIASFLNDKNRRDLRVQELQRDQETDDA